MQEISGSGSAMKLRIPKLKINKYVYDYVFGSRKVIKDPNNPDQNHFYGEDVYTREGKKLEGLLPA